MDELLRRHGYAPNKRGHGISKFIELAQIKKETYYRSVYPESASLYIISDIVLIKIAITLELSDEDIDSLCAQYGRDITTVNYPNIMFKRAIDISRNAELQGIANLGARHDAVREYWLSVGHHQY